MTKLEDQISYSCGCIGPQNGEPFCPCMMRAKRVTIKNGRYVVPEQDLGPVQSDLSVGIMKSVVKDWRNDQA